MTKQQFYETQREEESEERRRNETIEECAKVADRMLSQIDNLWWQQCAAAIRALKRGL